VNGPSSPIEKTEARASSADGTHAAGRKIMRASSSTRNVLGSLVVLAVLAAGSMACSRKGVPAQGSASIAATTPAAEAAPAAAPAVNLDPAPPTTATVDPTAVAPPVTTAKKSTAKKAAAHGHGSRTTAARASVKRAGSAKAKSASVPAESAPAAASAGEPPASSGEKMKDEDPWNLRTKSANASFDLKPYQ
jgi:hypothetical protein